MQTRLFFLYPNTATAAINGLNSTVSTISLGLIILACVSALIGFRLKSVPKSSIIHYRIAFYAFFLSLLVFSYSASFPTEPKINSMPPNSIIPTRLIICNKDVMNITGCTDSTASRKLQQVKDAHAKKEHQEVTIKEYCLYYSLDYREICEFLKLLK